MKEKFYVALGLCISYLDIDETVSLLATSKSAQFLHEFVREVVLSRTISLSSTYLSQLGKRFPRVTSLELQSLRSYSLNFQCFPNLTYLKLDSTFHKVESEIEWKGKITTLKVLCMTRVTGGSVHCAMGFITRFSMLSSLTLDHFMPLLVIQIQELVEQLPQLQDLNIRQCFTDRNPLMLPSIPLLRTFAMVNCPNIIGIHLPVLERLSTCDIVNCPISSKSVECIVSCCPVLKILRVEKCSLLQHRLNFKHKRLQTLSLYGCMNLTDLYVDCTRLDNINVQLCSSLVSCVVRSDCLRSIDLCQLMQLCSLHLDCPFLHHLDIVGCTNIGTKDRRGYLKQHYVSQEGEMSQAELSDSEDSDLESVTNSVEPVTKATPYFEEDNDNLLPGEQIIRHLSLYSPYLNLRHVVEEGTRATSLHAKRELLLEIVSQFCADKSIHESTATVARITPLNSPARRGRGNSPRSPRSEVKVKKPNRRAARRASA